MRLRRGSPRRGLVVGLLRGTEGARQAIQAPVSRRAGAKASFGEPSHQSVLAIFVPKKAPRAAPAGDLIPRESAHAPAPSGQAARTRITVGIALFRRGGPHCSTATSAYLPIVEATKGLRRRALSSLRCAGAKITEKR